MQHLFSKGILMTSLIIITGFLSSLAQNNLNPSYQLHTIEYDDNKKVQEFKLPSDIKDGRIYLSAYGGDGGARWNEDRDELLGGGGQGAQIGAWFEIGTGPNKIPPGATILLILGERGDSVEKDGDGAGAGAGGSAIFFQEKNGHWTLLIAAGGGGGGAKGYHGDPGEIVGCVNNSSSSFGQFDVHCIAEGPYSSFWPCDAGGGALWNPNGQQYQNPIDEKYYTCNTAGGIGWPGASTLPTSPVKPRGGEGAQLKSGINGGFGFGGGSGGSKTSVFAGAGGGFTGDAGIGGGSYMNPSMKMSSYPQNRILRGATANPQHGRVEYQIISAPVAVCNDITIEVSNPDPKFIDIEELAGNTFSYFGEDLSITTPEGLDNGTTIRLSCENEGVNQIPIEVYGTESGFFSYCTATVTIVDKSHPIISCKDIEVEADVNGRVYLKPEQLLKEYSSICGLDEPANLWLDNNIFENDCSDGNPHIETVLLTAENEIGVTASCTSRVTIDLSQQFPVAKCKPITVDLSAQNPTVITADMFDNGSFDPCGRDIISYGLRVFFRSSFKMEIRTDLSNSDFEWFIQRHDGVIVHSGQNNYENDPQFSNPSAEYAYFEEEFALPAPSFSPGFYRFIFKDKDGRGPACGSEQEFYYRLSRIHPVQDYFYQDCENMGNEVNEVINVFSDLYAEQWTVDCSWGDGGEVGFVVTNEDGGRDACYTNLIIKGVEPEISCKPATIQVNPNKAVSLPASAILNSASSLCDNITSVQYGMSSLKLKVRSDGFNQDMMWSITSLDGNTVFAERGDYQSPSNFIEDIQIPPGCYRFNWRDNHGDGFGCSAGRTYFYRLTDNDGNTLAYGECQEIGREQSTEFCVKADTFSDILTFDCNNPGVHHVGLIATNSNGQSGSCQTTISVEGGPKAICQPVTVQLDSDNQAIVNATDLDAGSFSTCGDIVSYQFEGSQAILLIQSDGNNDDFRWTITSLDGNHIYAQNDGYGQYDNSIREFRDTIILPLGCYMFNWVDKSGDGFNCSDSYPYSYFRLIDAISSTLIRESCENIGSGSSTQFCLKRNTLGDKMTFDCEDSGQHEVGLIVRDEIGNTVSCKTTITIEGAEEKEIECVSEPINLQLDEKGKASLSPEQLLVDTYSPCQISNMSLDQTEFDCSLSSKLVTLTINHSDGTVSTCENKVQIVDDTPPNPVCQDVTVQLEDDGTLTLDASVFDKESKDNCGISDLYFSDFTSTKSFTCSDVGVYDLFDIIVEDHSSNLSYCSVKFTLEDKTAPEVITTNITIQLDAKGTVSITAADIDNGSSDACGIKEMSLSQTDFNTSHLGENKVILTVTDINGNTSSKEATVTVMENIAPTAICQDVTVKLDENGNGSTTAADVNNGSNDASGIKELSLSQTDFSCGEIGDRPVVLTVTDNAGNSSTCDATVTVVDEIAPNAICNNQFDVYLDQKGDGILKAEDLNGTSSDNCGILTFEFLDGSMEKTFNCDSPNSSETLIVKDKSGNESFCLSNVSIKDEIPPTANCKENYTVQLNKFGIVTINAQELDNGSRDNCGALSFEFSDGYTENTFSCGGLDASVVLTLVVIDKSGNDRSCKTTVLFEDNVGPFARCKNPTIYLDDNGQATIDVDQINDNSADPCGLAEMTLDKTTVSCSDNTVKLTVRDVNGNESSCTATVITLDEIPPVPDVTDLPDITAECSTTVTAPTATDNCGGTITATTNDPLSYSSQGTHIITWSFDDGNGNIHTQTQRVIIKDVSNPVPDQASLPVVKGECSVSVSAVPTATDKCEGKITGTTSDPLTYSSLGTHTLTWTFDDGNGNTVTQTQTVIVEDVTKPVPDLSTLPTVTGECSATVSSTPTAKDNCNGQTIIGTTSDPLTYSTQGTHIVTWSFDDGNGNVATQPQTVIVDDVTKPVPDLNSLPDLTAECAVTVSSAPTATDNCEGTIIGTTNDPLSYSSQGTHIINWIFDDGNGNVSTQTQTVIIKDLTAPVPDVATLPTINGNCEAGLEPPFATDNCAGQVVGTTSDPLYFDKEGTYTVTWVFDDGNGNTSSQDQTIIIEDDIAPVPDRNNLPTLRAQCGLTVSTKPTATDRCAGTIVGTTSDPLTYNTQGIHLITWTYDDGNGNAVTQTQRVVIRDNKAPVPDQASLPALTGSCSVMITQFPTATDNCTGSVTATTDSPLEFDQEGTFAILWNYDDGNGNTSVQTQWVIVGGDVAPNARCKDISMPMAGNGSVNISASDIDNGSFDDCSSVTLLISPAGGSIFGTGLPPAPNMDLHCKDGKEQNLLLSVTNEKGNTAQCQARVTLEGTDSDADGLLDSCDNCPNTYNLNQKDSNNNGTGDACEENSNPDPNPGGWGGWSLKKQGKEEFNIITELKAFPNPFKEDLNLSFNLSQEERTTIEIFNIQGQRVHTLLSEVIPGGEHRVLWDGKDQNGQAMPAGIYLVRLRAGKALINQKVILQR